MKQEMKKEVVDNIAEVELIYHNKVKPSDRPRITNHKDTYKILLDHWNKDTIELLEEFKIILLNRSARVLGIHHLSKGSMTGTAADPKLIFSIALKAAATAIILAHNHPSGELNPSESDRILTGKIEQAGKVLDLLLLDHLIVSPYGYFSFANEGLL